jgi:hypothetical protein
VEVNKSNGAIADVDRIEWLYYPYGTTIPSTGFIPIDIDPLPRDINNDQYLEFLIDPTDTVFAAQLASFGADPKEFDGNFRFRAINTEGVVSSAYNIRVNYNKTDPEWIPTNKAEILAGPAPFTAFPSVRLEFDRYVTLEYRRDNYINGVWDSASYLSASPSTSSATYITLPTVTNAVCYYYLYSVVDLWGNPLPLLTAGGYNPVLVVDARTPNISVQYNSSGSTWLNVTTTSNNLLGSPSLPLDKDVDLRYRSTTIDYPIILQYSIDDGDNWVTKYEGPGNNSNANLAANWLAEHTLNGTNGTQKVLFRTLNAASGKSSNPISFTAYLGTTAQTIVDANKKIDELFESTDPEERKETARELFDFATEDEIDQNDLDDTYGLLEVNDDGTIKLDSSDIYNGPAYWTDPAYWLPPLNLYSLLGNSVPENGFRFDVTIELKPNLVRVELYYSIGLRGGGYFKERWTQIENDGTSYYAYGHAKSGPGVPLGSSTSSVWVPFSFVYEKDGVDLKLSVYADGNFIQDYIFPGDTYDNLRPGSFCPLRLVVDDSDYSILIKDLAILPAVHP